MTSRLTRLAWTAVTAGVILTVAACSSTTPAATSTAAAVRSGGGPIAVVASTDVWGDLAATVGGDAVSVTSIISDPNQDPHSYEASAQNQLALSKAAVVVENGGGYDDFVDTMLAAAHNPSAVVLNAVTISGKAAAGGQLNEHVWYDFPTVEKVVGQIADAYGRLDPARADTFRQNAAGLTAQLQALVQREAQLKATYAGAGVSITEPVPLYLLQAIGLVNRTPAEFSHAIEDGTDVAPAVLQQTLALYTDHAVRLLAYNEQTTGPETEAVLKAARANGVSVVPVTETLPAGDTYVSWMTANLAAVAAALAG